MREELLCHGIDGFGIGLIRGMEHLGWQSDPELVGIRIGKPPFLSQLPVLADDGPGVNVGTPQAVIVWVAGAPCDRRVAGLGCCRGLSDLLGDQRFMTARGAADCRADAGADARCGLMRYAYRGRRLPDSR